MVFGSKKLENMHKELVPVSEFDNLDNWKHMTCNVATKVREIELYHCHFFYINIHTPRLCSGIFSCPKAYIIEKELGSFLSPKSYMGKLSELFQVPKCINREELFVIFLGPDEEVGCTGR